MRKDTPKPGRNRKFEALAGTGRPGPAGKQDAILRDLKHRIVSGQFPAGSRLPTRTELVKAYGVSIPTVQATLSRLSAEGFVEARGNHGTFVRERPPHASRIGVVVRVSQDGSQTAIGKILHRLMDDRAQSGELTFSLYALMESDNLCPALETLIDDIHEHRLAGLLCESTFFPSRTDLSQAIVTRKLPCVAISNDMSDYGPSIKRLVVDQRRVLTAGLKALADAGARNIAVIEAPIAIGAESKLIELARSLRLSLQRKHILGVDPRSAVHARPLAELLATLSPAIDGLYLGHDGVAEQASLGLLDAGVAVPRDLVVVSHANFPYPSVSSVPAIRVGVDINEAFYYAQKAVQAGISGQTWPELTSLGIRIDGALTAEDRSNLIH